MKQIICKREKRQFVSGAKFFSQNFLKFFLSFLRYKERKIGKIKNEDHRACLFVKAFASSTFPRISSRTSKSGF